MTSMSLLSCSMLSPLVDYGRNLTCHHQNGRPSSLQKLASRFE